MNNPLISVIVPIYNVELYINRCINSIINQTYDNLEIILVDDGSPDNCPQICEEWKTKDKRINIIHKQNGGLSSARNAGISIAKGEYLCFVDSDDFIENCMIKDLVNSIRNTDSDLACCGRYVLYDDGRKEKKFTLDKDIVISSEVAMREMLRGTFIGEPAWDKVYKKELFEDIRFPEGEINEDIVIMPLIFKKCKNIVHVSKPYYYYCKNGESITRSGYSKRKQVILNHLEQMKELIDTMYPNLNDDFKCFNAKYSLSMLYLILENKETKQKYIDDYNSFYSNLKNNFKFFMSSPYISKTEKVKSFLILTNTYLFLKNLKKEFLNE